MNTRKLIINIHLILAALFLPMLLLMPLTGALYILGYKGDAVKTEVFTINANIPSDSKEQETFFRAKFKEAGIDYNFEYIKMNKNEYIFRPQTKLHYIATKQEADQIVFTKIEPNFLFSSIELHKSHGPLMMKWFQVGFGLALILTTLSGLWLAITVKAYRVPTFISFAIGCLVIFLCFI